MEMARRRSDAGRLCGGRLRGTNDILMLFWVPAPNLYCCLCSFMWPNMWRISIRKFHEHVMPLTEQHLGSACGLACIFNSIHDSFGLVRYTMSLKCHLARDRLRKNGRETKIIQMAFGNGWEQKTSESRTKHEGSEYIWHSAFIIKIHLDVRRKLWKGFLYTTQLGGDKSSQHNEYKILQYHSQNAEHSVSGVAHRWWTVSFAMPAEGRRKGWRKGRKPDE